MMPVALSLDDFAPHVGQWFAVDGVDGALELLAASALRHESIGGRRGFTLLFRGGRERPLGQGMRALAHPVVGTHDIFLVPVGLGPQGYEYEAVFN